MTVTELIDKLRKKTKKKEGDLKVYDEHGSEIPKEEKKEVIKDYWENIYGMHENNIKEVWNVETKRTYLGIREENMLSKNYIRIQVENEQGDDLVVWGEGTLAYLDAVCTVKRVIKEMEYPAVEEELKESLRKLKNKKAAGPDKMKVEFYKTFQDSEKFIKLLTESFRQIIERGKVPESWKESRTVMIPRKSKPKVLELRPITVTNTSHLCQSQ